MNSVALACFISTLGLLSCEASDVDTPVSTTALVDGNNAFALDLYAQLSRGQGNRFVSPFSIACALAMTYAGAQGETAREIAKALHFTLGPGELHPAFHHLIAELHSRNISAPARRLCRKFSFSLRARSGFKRASTSWPTSSGRSSSTTRAACTRSTFTAPPRKHGGPSTPGSRYRPKTRSKTCSSLRI